MVAVQWLTVQEISLSCSRKGLFKVTDGGQCILQKHQGYKLPSSTCDYKRLLRESEPGKACVRNFNGRVLEVHLPVQFPVHAQEHGRLAKAV